MKLDDAVENMNTVLIIIFLISIHIIILRMQFQNKAYFNYDNKDQYFHFASMILDH